jgi:anti-sigma regulatory factor (Ser/Thr protein kinase)
MSEAIARSASQRSELLVNCPEVDRIIDALKTHVDVVVPTPIQMDQLREVIQRALTAHSGMPPIEVLRAGLKWIELLVPCAREAAERTQHFIDQLESDLDVDARESIALAFRELLLNAVEWGGKLDSTQRVRVIRMRARGVLVYRITDPGQGFRFDDLPHAAVAHAGENAIAHMEVRDRAGMRAGGFGLMLVRAIADELMYNDRGNEVTFVKYLAEPSWTLTATMARDKP